jgi:hypothetical protein
MSVFNFIGSSYTSASLNQNAQRTYNLYPEQDESGTGKNKWILLGTPGLLLEATLPTSPVRCLFAGGSLGQKASRLFCVAGSKLYEISSTGAIVGGMNRGDVGDDADHSPAQIFANGNQLMIISAGAVYIDNGGAASGANAQPAMYHGSDYAGTVDTIGLIVILVSGTPFTPAMVGGIITINLVPYAVSGFANPSLITIASTAGVQSSVAYSSTVAGAPVLGTTGGFLDGYFIAQTPESNQIQISALNNGLDWNAIDFGVKEGAPDHILSILVDHEELWLFGDNTTEVWRNTGNAKFPLERDPGAFIQQGSAAAFGPVSLNNGVAWIGSDTLGNCAAWFAAGYQPVRISTHAVETIWSDYTVTDARSFVYENAGHVFWVINFPFQGKTWVYDATETLWHERGSLVSGAQTRNLANCHAFAFNNHYVGDFATGNIYVQSLHVFDDNGAAITRIRTAPHISDEQKWIFYEQFQLDMETGVGSTFNVTLDYSNDGGHTFGAQHTIAAGGTTEYKHRVIWRRLGRARDRVFRVTITAAVKVALINAYLRNSAGTF